MKRNSWIKLLPLIGLGIFSSLIVAVRILFATTQVKNDLMALDTATPLVIGETSSLEILPLYEAVASGAELDSGLGVSYLIRTDTATILFDVGNNPEQTSPSPVEINMQALGVDFTEIDMIVISHTHFDHLGGKGWQSKGTFGIGGQTQISLEDRPIYIPEELTYPGSLPEIVESPRMIADGVAITGAIPYIYPFPAWLAIPKGVEQSIIVNVKDQGLVVIVGCGHMHLNSLLQHVQAVFDEPIIGVVGGLHLGNADDQVIQSDIDLLTVLDPRLVAISPHDTFANGLMAFQKAFPTAYQPVAVGSLIQLP